MIDGQLVKFLIKQDYDVYIVMHHEKDDSETDILIITIGRVGSSIRDGVTAKWTVDDIDIFGFDVILQCMLLDLDERILNAEE